MRLPNFIYRSSLGYWLTAKHCTCRGFPVRFRGCTVEVGGIKHCLDRPCHRVDIYGNAIEADR